MTDQTIDYQYRDFVIAFDADNPAGPHWCSDGYGGRKCWIKGETLIYGCYKVIGPAMHADPSGNEAQRQCVIDAKEKLKRHEEELATLPELPGVSAVMHAKEWHESNAA